MGSACGGRWAWGSLVLLLGLCIWTAVGADRSPVRNLRRESQTNSSVTLTWEAPEDPDNETYTYRVNWTGNGVTNETQDITNTNYTAENLQAATEYTFWVWALSNGQESTAEKVTAFTDPSPVRNLRNESQTNSSVTLTWEVPKGPENVNYNYRVNWTGNGVTNGTHVNRNTNYTVENLQAATEYTFWVWALSNGQESTAEKVTAFTDPSPVTNLRNESQTNSSVTLTWEVPKGPENVNYNYRVNWTGNGVTNGTHVNRTTKYTVENLQAATEYTFWVWALSNGQESTAEKVTAFTDPSPVTNLRNESQTNSSVTLTWEVPKGPENVNYNYRVNWTGNGVTNETHVNRTTNYTVENLQAATEYTFWVWALSNGQESTAEKVTAFTDPSPVTNLRNESQTNSSVTLTWEVPKGPENVNYNYRVNWTGNGVTNETLVNRTTNYTVENLQAATEYTFWVWALSNGQESTAEKVTAFTDPSPVRNLRNESQTNSSVTLSWEAPNDPDNANYIYQVNWTGNGVTNEIQNTTNTNYIVENLQAATEYTFSVWTLSNGQESTAEKVTAFTDPSPVRNLRIESQTNSSVILTWEAPDDPDNANYIYRVNWTGNGVTNEIQNTTNKNYIVKNLKAATEYTFWVWTLSNGQESTAEKVTAFTDPSPVRNLRNESQTNSSVTLTWEVPEDPDNANYIYRVNWTRNGVTNEIQNTTNTNYIVKNLKAATEYTFWVWTLSNGQESTAEKVTAFTVPNPVRNIRAESQTNSSITLCWDVPEGPDTESYTFHIQWTRPDVTNEIQSTTDTKYTASGLQPGTLYRFSAWAERNRLTSSPVQDQFSTAHNPVRTLRVLSQTTNTITLSWEVPDGPDPQNYTYWVQWHGSDTFETQATKNRTYIAERLAPGLLYDFSVWIETNGVDSSTELVPGTTTPNQVMNLHNETRTNNSITLRWDAPGDPTSQLYRYQVQWGSGAQRQQEQTNETFYRVKGLEPGTLYSLSVRAERNNVTSSTQSLRASTGPDPVRITSCTSASGGYGLVLTCLCPRGGFETFLLEVNGQRFSLDNSSCEREVAVWRLQPARSYVSSIQTFWDGMEAPGPSVTCHTSSAGVIAGSFVGVLLAVILVGVLLFFLRRRRSEKQPASGNPVFSFHRDIRAADFAEHVRGKEKDSNWGFAEDYQLLDQEDQHRPLQTVASAPENQSKNRYRNVLPYDCARVPLKTFPGELGSDYINASFIPSLWKTKEFIATQGPLPHTVGDFWRLVWEQQSHTLVMLTNCMESGRVKCEYYWPLDAQPCTHGHLQVTLKEEDVKENWTIRTLKLRHTQEQKMLMVRQFHYKSWPDHGVPHCPDPLLNFRKLFREWLDCCPQGGLPIVHCSAGVGRTGTFIALDVLLRQLEHEGCVGPFRYVKKMRESRPLMVQTEAQYVFLHQCILRYLEQSSPNPAEDEALYENDTIYENVGAI